MSALDQMANVRAGRYSTCTFSLCHTTKRLPDGWREAAGLWMSRADNPIAIEYILSVDMANWTRELGEFDEWPYSGLMLGSRRLIVNRGRETAADGWNAAVKNSSGDFIITVADDLIPPPHWDTEILKVIPDLSGEYVLAPDLSGDYPLITFCFLTRAYLKRLEREHGYRGGAWYPEYYGMRADNDFDACARMDRVVIAAPHIKVEHKHPTYGTAEWDDTYRWQHRHEAFQVGNRIFERRKREGFRL